MPPRVSFVIPVLNEAAAIGDLLAVLRARFPDAELIVIDGGSSDETVARAMPACDQLLVGERGRAAQMNLGARVANGDYLFFLHADSSPTVRDDDLHAYLARDPDWGFCTLELDAAGVAFRVIEWFINRRSRLTCVGTGDQMLFMSRQCFERCGGYDAIELMEDVALCKRLRPEARPLLIAEPVITSARRWQQGGVLRTVLRMWGLRLAYALGVPPRRLARHYRHG